MILLTIPLVIVVNDVEDNDDTGDDDDTDDDSIRFCMNFSR